MSVYDSNFVDYINQYTNPTWEWKHNPNCHYKLSIVDKDGFESQIRMPKTYTYCLRLANEQMEIPLYWFNLKFPTKKDFDNNQGLLANSTRGFIPDDEEFYNERVEKTY